MGIVVSEYIHNRVGDEEYLDRVDAFLTDNNVDVKLFHKMMKLISTDMDSEEVCRLLGIDTDELYRMIRVKWRIPFEVRYGR